MQILFVNKFFFPNGGSETVFFQERNGLLQKGHRVIDYSMQHSKNAYSAYSGYFLPNIDYESKGVDQSDSSFGKLRAAVDFIHNREAIRRLKLLLQREKPEIAHLHNIYHQITPSVIDLLKHSGVKVVLTVHDYKLICPTYTMLNNHGGICSACHGKHFWKATLHKCQDGSYAKSALLTAEAYWHKMRKSYQSVDLFLCPSRFLSELMAENRISRDKIEVLHNGIDTDRSLPSTVDHNYAVYLGRISKEKGIEVLLEAYASLLADGTIGGRENMRLKIIGTGPLLPELSAKYPCAEFLGFKTGSELKKLITHASFTVVPSQWYENCSMSVLESMAYGKPVIASRIGGIPEQIEDYKTGLLFEMGSVWDLRQKFRLLAENSGLRMKMGQAARRKLEAEYSFATHLNRLVQIYEKLVWGIQPRWTPGTK